MSKIYPRTGDKQTVYRKICKRMDTMVIKDYPKVSMTV